MDRPARDILFFAQRVPYPPDRGDRITTWHLLRHFLGRGDRVRVACFLESERDESSARELRSMGCELAAARIHPRLRKLRCLPGLLGRQPLTLPYFFDRGLLEQCRSWARERPPGIGFAYSSSSGQYFLALGPLLRDCRKVMHFAELDSDKWAQYAKASRFPARAVYAREARTLLRFEQRLARAVDLNLVVSEAELALFRQRIPGVEAEILPNGVDLEHFAPGPVEEREAHTLIFSGVMNYKPNVDAMLRFVDGVWPAIRLRWPSARLLIVGSEPTCSIRALSGSAGIEVSGRVASTVPWFRRATAAIVPLRIARGIQNKVLEAMAMALPVVASSRALQGIQAREMQEVLVADDTDALTKSIHDLFENPALGLSIGKAARALVEEQHAWPRILERFESLVERLDCGRSETS